MRKRIRFRTCAVIAMSMGEPMAMAMMRMCPRPGSGTGLAVVGPPGRSG